MTATLIPAALLIAVAASVAAQSPATTTPAASEFAIASIKPSAPPTGGPMFMDYGPRPGGGWASQNAPFILILRSAYPDFSLPGQIVGGPEWIHTGHFDINARAEGDPSRDVITTMLRRLLSDRFSLKVRTEQREMDVYALVLARADGRLGPGLRKVAVDCQAINEARKKAAAAGAPPAQVAPLNLAERPQCAMMSRSMNGVMKLLAGGTAISAAAIVLQSTVGRPIVERTGLTGLFDIDLEYAGTTQLAASPDQPNAPASVFTAVQEQLGLKLESRKEKMDVLVIDQIELPTPN
jgi:uncharacterized protein (TIGR03435 family)